MFVLVPIIPDYLYHLKNPTSEFDETYRILAKNCSNSELIKQRNYFVRHPTQFRRLLRTTCNWTVDWAMNRIDLENQQRTIILENVRREKENFNGNGNVKH